MAAHHSTIKPADDPAFRLPAKLAGLTIPMLIGGIVLLVLGFGLSTFGVNASFGMSAYLTAFMYCTTIAIGSLFFVLVQHLCRAGWSVVVRRVAELMMVMIIPLSVLFLPVLFSLASGDVLYKWNSDTFATDGGFDPAIWLEKTRWLTPGWFAARSIIYLVVWSMLAVYYFRRSRLQDETGEKTLTETMQARSGPAIIAFSFCTTFAAFDWLMSLAPMWFSTMFGVYIFTGSILSAHCAIAVLTFILQKQGAMRDEVTIEHYHDLGKLIFGFICFWGYIAFSQYMLIWYANIPEETHWFYERSEGLWGTLSVFLMIAHWGIPFAAIMSRHIRRKPWLVATVAAYVLLMHYVDLYWVIMPESHRGGEHLYAGGVIGVAGALASVIGMVMLMWGLMLKIAGQTKLIPVRDPRLAESLAFHNV